MLHNIFKKTKSKKAKPLPAPKIIADYRERNSLVIPTLKELKVEVEIKELKVGDFQIGDITIERKTFNDFLESMINKRLLNQLKNLQQTKKAILILEGYDIDYLEKKERNINPNAVRGFILSISLEHNIPVITTEDAQETAIYLNVLAKKQLKKSVEISLHSRIPKTKKEQQKYILESFPNIGPKTAEKLLKHFRTIQNIMNAEEKEIQELIGKKSESIINLRNLKF